MGGGASGPTGPDLKAGVRFESLVEGVPLRGHLDGESVMLVRQGDAVFAIGATCSHYGGPLDEGLVVDGTVRCPWHHACFDLRTGEAIGAPALNEVPCFDVVRTDGLVTLGARRKPPARQVEGPSSVVVVGAGAAGAAAVEQLRRSGYGGPVTLVGDEAPVDRPNLSKDYLAGNAPEAWMPLRPPEFYGTIGVDFVQLPVTAIDPRARTVRLTDGRTLSYGALLLATGAEPRRLAVPGAERSHVLTLRTLADSREIIARARAGTRAVVIGASFIGLEVAMSLRKRGLEVDVVGPEPVPLARIVGDEVGAFVRRVHEGRGVRFHLGRKPVRITDVAVELDDGTSLEAELVVTGVGVEPRMTLAEAAGITVDNGIEVDEQLRTNVPDVWAAGDVARYPDPYGEGRIRVEHWVAAERQGQAAARSILGLETRFTDVPFFWSQHDDVALAYVGHGAGWDKAELSGDLDARDAMVVYRRRGRPVALLTVFRDRLSLEAEAALHAGGVEAFEALLARQ